MSACTPAPPPESDPAMASTRPRAPFVPLVMASGVADRSGHRKRLPRFGDVVDAQHRRAALGRRKRQGDRAAEALLGAGAIAGDLRDRALAAGAEHDPETERRDLRQAADEIEIVRRRLAEAEAGIDPDVLTRHAGRDRRLGADG